MRKVVFFAALATLASAPAFAQSAPVFSSSYSGFGFDNRYQGTLTYNGVNYTPPTGSGTTPFNLNNVAAGDSTDLTGTPVSGNATRYRIYKQNYSVIIGNVVHGGDQSWVKDIVGQNTALSALPTSGSYTYTGRSFWHDIPASDEGTLSYTVNLATRQGSGSVTGLKASYPALGSFTANATLNSAPIAVQSDGRLGVANGTASVTTTNALVNAYFALSGTSPKYDLGLYGPNAEEIAGALRVNSTVGSIGFYGAR